jgi:hypothetical protein
MMDHDPIRDGENVAMPYFCLVEFRIIDSRTKAEISNNRRHCSMR